MTDDNGRAGGSSSQERLAELERSVASLQAELATLRGGPAVVAVDGRASGPGSALPLLPTLPVADLPDSRTTRRALLGRMGLLGAGTAAGVLVAGTTAVPAAALPVTPTPAPTPGWVQIGRAHV